MPSSTRSGTSASPVRLVLPAWGSGPTLVLDQLVDTPGLDDQRSVRLVRAASGEGVPKALDPVVALQPAETALVVVEGQTATFFVFEGGTLRRQVTLGKPEHLERWTQAYLGMRLPKSEAYTGNSAIRLASVSGQPQLVALLREPVAHGASPRGSYDESATAQRKAASDRAFSSNASSNARAGTSYGTTASPRRESFWWTKATPAVWSTPPAVASAPNPQLARRVSTPRVDPSNPLRHLTVKAVLNSSDPLDGLTDAETHSD